MAASLRARLFKAKQTVTLGRYTLGRPLGEGAMGVVYEAQDPELERTVALKVLRGKHADAAAQARLIREAKSLAKLNHPNVLTVHEVGTVDGQVFIAMEFVDGIDLAEWIEANPPGSRARFETALSMAVAIADGLAQAHDADVTHRDIKPSNILIGREGRPRLADFGVARSAEHGELVLHDEGAGGAAVGLPTDSRGTLTATGQFVGSPAYMAPEQFAGVSDARSDQYGFCACFFEVFYGKRPIQARTLMELLESVETAEILPPEPGVPRWVYRVLRRGLEKHPEDRFESMRALAEALRQGDRAHRARPYWFGGALGLAALGMAIGVALQRGPDCDNAGSEIDAVWTAAVQGDVASHFETVGGGHATETWRRVQGSVDGWVERWKRRAAAACGLPESLTARAQRECLTEGRAALETTLDAFRDLSGDEVALALPTVLGLPPPERCADRDGATGLASSEVLIRLIADAKVQLELGRPERAAAVAVEAHDVAVEKGAWRHQADADRVRAGALLMSAEFEEAQRWAHESLDAGERANATEVQLDAWLVMHRLLLAWDKDELAAFALRRATSVAALASHRPELDAELAWRRAAGLREAGKLEDALEVFEEVERLLVENERPEADIASLYCDRAGLQRNLDQIEAAIASARTCRERYVSGLGELHPKHAISAGVLSELLLWGGQFEAAYDMGQRAEAVYVANPRYRPDYRAQTWTVIAAALLELNRTADARAAFERAAELADAAGSKELVMAARGQLAGMDLAAGDSAGAVRALEELVGDNSTISGPNAAVVRLTFAQALAVEGQPERAKRQLDKAVAVLGPFSKPGSAPYRMLLKTKANIFNLAGDYEDAAAQIREALADGGEVESSEHGELLGELARAQDGLGMPEASATLAQARAKLELAGAAGTQALGELDRWPWRMDTTP